MKMEIIGITSFFGMIIFIVVFLVFIGMFRRLGRIEGVLLRMASHQGVPEEETETKFHPSTGWKSKGR
jgi:hypothetical protein